MPYPSLPAYKPLEERDPLPSKKAPQHPEQAPKPPKQNEPRHSAKIESWDYQKGYGYLRHGKKRIFLHWRDFSERHKKPMPGDLIHFAVGQDPKGRTCAIGARHHNDGGRFTLRAGILLVAGLILPGLAVYRFHFISGIHAGWILAAALLISLVTYSQYATDKKRARSKTWRISEGSLHFWELIGGWPGAFVAQRRLRHKCSKKPFLVAFWLIVFLHQYLAFDYLRKWQTSRTLFSALGDLIEATSPNRNH